MYADGGAAVPPALGREEVNAYGRARGLAGRSPLWRPPIKKETAVRG
jgi:hypothetical protein